jgi:hypothetical protein
MMMATADAVASSIASLTWLLLEAKDDEFVTCDRGLAMHDPTPKFPWSGHALRSSPKAQTSYPLAPQHCLVLVQLPQPVAVVEADAEDVREFNLRAYGWASQYIYGRTQEVVQRVRIQAKDKPALVIRPRTPKPVILEEVDPNDPEVGKDHAKKGWPRTVAITDDDGNERIASYQLIDPKDEKSVAEAISAEEATQSALAAERARQAPANPTFVSVAAQARPPSGPRVRATPKRCREECASPSTSSTAAGHLARNRPRLLRRGVRHAARRLKTTDGWWTAAKRPRYRTRNSACWFIRGSAPSTATASTRSSSAASARQPVSLLAQSSSPCARAALLERQ